MRRRSRGRTTLKDRVVGSDPKTLLAIANEARSRQAGDLYAAAAAQLGETAPEALLEKADAALLARVARRQTTQAVDAPRRRIMS